MKAETKQLILPSFFMGLVILTSNYLVSRPINDWLTWGAFSYPLCFLVTDSTNRIYGVKTARKVVFFGFIFGAILSLPHSFRIGTASISAYLISQLLDITIFDKLRQAKWWKAPSFSSCLSSIVDTFLFFSIAFVGTGMPWITWAIGDYGAKIFMVVVLLYPFRLMILKDKLYGANCAS